MLNNVPGLLSEAQKKIQNTRFISDDATGSFLGGGQLGFINIESHLIKVINWKGIIDLLLFFAKTYFLLQVTQSLVEGPNNVDSNHA